MAKKVKASPAPKKTKPIKKEKAKVLSKASKEKKSAKIKASKKEPTKKETQNATLEEKPSHSGYVFYKSPKYFKLAEKISKLSPEDIPSFLESNPFKLQEKIHVGNLVSSLSSKICQHGTVSTNYCYGNLNEKYKKTYLDLMDNWTVNKLRDVLVLNEQPKTATKNILCERVADGITLGRIPKCPNCLGGRMRFNNKTGEYFCPGYIDGGYFYSDLGDDYIFCNKRFNLAEIARDEWKSLS